MRFEYDHFGALNNNINCAMQCNVRRMQGRGRQENSRTWSMSETVHLVRLYASYGNKWKCLGKQLGRSGDSVRNKYQRMIKKPDPLKKAQRCRMCGQPRRGHVCLFMDLKDGIDLSRSDVFPYDSPPVIEYTGLPAQDLCQDVEKEDNLDMDVLIECLKLV